MSEKAFYERQPHEQILSKIDELKQFIDEQEKSDLTPTDQQELLGLKEELEGYKVIHDQSLNRAWMEATKLNELYDYQQQKAEAEEASMAEYSVAQTEFVEYFINHSDLITKTSALDITIESSLPGVAENSLKTLTNEGSTYFDLTLSYPELQNSAEPRVVEKSVTLTINCQDGDILNWDDAPVPLKQVQNGRILVLKEIINTIESLGLRGMPSLTIDEPLVISDEGEPVGPTKPSSEEEARVRNFQATERFKILQSYNPLFDVNNVEGGQYTAFVFEDFILFDSLQYGNGIFFIKLDETVDLETQDQLNSIHKQERDEAMRKILLGSDFYEDIKKTRSERKAEGRRYPGQHPSRPEDADTNTNYQQKLQQYYEGVFNHIRNQVLPDTIQPD